MAKDYVAWMMFDRYDLTGDGKIGPRELAAMCSGLGKALTEAQLQQALTVLDADGDGLISFGEFYEWWKAGISTEALLDRGHAQSASIGIAAQRVAAAAAAEPQDAKAVAEAAAARRREERDEVMGGVATADEHTKEGPGRFTEQRGSFAAVASAKSNSGALLAKKWMADRTQSSAVVARPLPVPAQALGSSIGPHELAQPNAAADELLFA